MYIPGEDAFVVIYASDELLHVKYEIYAVKCDGAGSVLAGPSRITYTDGMITAALVSACVRWGLLVL